MKKKGKYKIKPNAKTLRQHFTAYQSPTADLMVHEAVKPMTRGQITLPKELREMMGIDENTWLWIDYNGKGEVMLKKVEKDERLEQEKLARQREKQLEALKYFAKEAKGRVLWTEEDDKAREERKAASRKRAEYLEGLWAKK